ncbi:MAG: MBL fold metallo-hydrolase [Bacteroidetes bacterium]|nr:MBL fold metallo-hydrolase [Bacteroidota bacterium]
MNVTFLGTGTSQGVPVIACDCDVCQSEDPKDDRLRTSVLVQVDGKNLVIDSGPDFRQQLLRENVKRLDGILFTHSHRDHTAGLDDVRAFNFIQKQDIDVYASEETQESLKNQFYYIFERKYPGVPRIVIHTIENEPFYIDQTKIIPIQVTHLNLNVQCFRINDFTYVTDANEISDEEKSKIKGSKVIVLNVLRKEEHVAHFNLEQGLALFEELKPEKGYITHISHQLGKHEDISKELPHNIELAYDGLQVSL